jgi:hypothetical protein
VNVFLFNNAIRIRIRISSIKSMIIEMMVVMMVAVMVMMTTHQTAKTIISYIIMISCILSQCCAPYACVFLLLSWYIHCMYTYIHTLMPLAFMYAPKYYDLQEGIYRNKITVYYSISSTTTSIMN